MFKNIGTTEIILIVVIVLLIFGGKIFPKIGKGIGVIIGGLKDWISGKKD
jgi:Sec-independent protein translocase protein TatA